MKKKRKKEKRNRKKIIRNRKYGEKKVSRLYVQFKI